jgi:septal ring factor EnvC (AmiA/AmiB activator)
MALLRKGLRDIGTLSGRVDRVSLPYRAFLKISCLEMEKARRTRERDSARQNIAKIDARLQEIEAEKAALLKALQEVADNDSGQEVAAPGPEARPSPGQFKFRY